MILEQYSSDLVIFARENLSVKDYENLMVMMESDNGKIDVHKGFLKKIVGQIQKFISVDKFRSKIFSDAIAKTHGDITKVKDIDITIKTLKALKKSKDSVTKQEAETILKLYSQVESHKNEFMKLYALKKSGSNLYEKTMAGILYDGYVLYVQLIEANTSLLLSKLHDPKSKNPYISYSGSACLARALKDLESGTLKKAVNALKKKDASEAIELVLIFGTLFAFITLCLSIRMFVYYFYYTRMQLSDYFEQQSKFLDMHKMEVKRNDEITAREKDSVLSAQKAWAERFMKLSEMIKDDDIAAAKKSSTMLKKTNKEVIQDTPTNKIDVANTGMDFF